MKKSIFSLSAVVALFMMSCGEPAYINGPGDNSQNMDSIPLVMPDTNGIEVSVDSAIAICNALGANQDSPDRYKITGVVMKNTTNPMSVPGQYTNINFELTDNGKTSISCYYINNVYNHAFRNSNDVPRVGSKVTVLGTLTLYQKSGGTATPELKNGFIVRIDSMVAPGPFPGCPDPDSTQISASEAVTMALQLEDKKESKDFYDVIGVVTEVLEFNSGKATYIISDGKAYFEIYRGIGMNNAEFPSAEHIAANDTVVVHCKLKNYSGTAETADNAYLLSTTNKKYNE